MSVSSTIATGAMGAGLTSRNVPSVDGAGAIRIVGVLALIAVVGVIYTPTIVAIVGHWPNDGYQHAYLVPLISMGLIWRARFELARCRWTGSSAGIAALAIAVSVWLVARAVALDVVEQFAVVSMSLAIVLGVCGPRTFRAIWFPLAFLVFALPVGGSLIRHLMEITADLVAWGLKLIGTPVHREGMVLLLPNGTFEVAEVCSGLNYLNAGLATGVLAGHLFLRSLARQALFAIGIASALIIMNGLRALVVVAVANATHMRFLAGSDHVVFGWVLFTCLVGAAFWAADRLSESGQ